MSSGFNTMSSDISDGLSLGATALGYEGQYIYKTETSAKLCTLFYNRIELTIWIIMHNSSLLRSSLQCM